MAPYFNHDQSSLFPPIESTMKKSKSETYLELFTNPYNSSLPENSTNFLTHYFVDYETFQKGEKCHGCSVLMKGLRVKSCRGMYIIYIYILIDILKQK
jgi:hypothetical protein